MEPKRKNSFLAVPVLSRRRFCSRSFLRKDRRRNRIIKASESRKVASLVCDVVLSVRRLIKVCRRMIEVFVSSSYGVDQANKLVSFLCL